MPDLTNRQIVLRRRPTGLVDPSDTELLVTPAPSPAAGEALVRTTYVGIDAAARTWLNDQPGYLPPVQLGEVIRAAGIGEVVESRCDAYAVGDVVTTLSGFQEYVIVRDDVFCTPVTGMAEVDQPAVMSIYGPTGATAYFGMHDIGRPAEGDTVVVSAAAGATGSVAGQIAKIAGARVVGIAGGPEKCRAVVEEFGFDACIDYREGDVAAALKRHCPEASTSTSTTSAVRSSTPSWDAWPPRRRVVLCGVISSYLTGEHPGPANYVNILVQDRDHAGVQRARRVGPVRRGLRRAARLGGAGTAGAPRDDLRGHRIVRRCAQRSVHGRQHRQDAGQGRRAHSPAEALRPSLQSRGSSEIFCQRSCCTARW